MCVYMYHERQLMCVNIAECYLMPPRQGCTQKREVKTISNKYIVPPHWPGKLNYYNYYTYVRTLYSKTVPHTSLRYTVNTLDPSMMQEH